MDENFCDFYVPPERLRRVIESMLADGGLRGQNTGLVFARAMELEEPEKRTQWYRGASAFVDLLDLAQSFVANRTESFHGSPYQKAFTGIRAIIDSLDINTAWQSYFESFRPYVDTSLPLIIYATTPPGPIARVPKAGRDDLIASIDSVVEKVKQSELPSLLKQQLVRKLADLRATLDKYNLYGMEGVEEAAASVVATIFVEQEGAKKSTETIKEVLDLIIKVEDVVLKAVAIGVLLNPAVSGLLAAVTK